jgi:hypothetical protein
VSIHTVDESWAAPAPGESLAALDLFALGRRAAAARDARFGRRGAFVRTRQLAADGSWRGPRDAALAYIDDADLTAAGGLAEARGAGVGLLIAGGDPGRAAAAADAGLEVVWRVPFANGESDGERLARLAALAGLAPRLAGLLPAPVGEPYGLDTLRMFALCRLALPGVPHLLADVTTLGPRLAQMTFGFGADELRAPIVAERALRLGANANNPALTRKEAATLIRGAGLTPCERLADGTLEEVTA